jgi:hypothetical protein
MADSYADLYNQFYPFWNTPKIFKCLINVSSQYDIKKYGAVNTPHDLVKEIVNRIPDKAFDENVLDPACGHGTFLYEAKQRMMKNGLSSDDAINNIYGVDIDLRKCYISSAILNPEGEKVSNIFWANALTGTNQENPTKQAWTEMKFKVVLGNPPYQSDKKTGTQPFWSLFVNNGIKSLKNDGYFAFVTPIKWLGHTANIVKGRIHLYKDILKGKLIYANSQECSRYFPNVGNTGDMFSYFVGTMAGSNEFHFKNKDDEYIVSDDMFEYLPLQFPTKTTADILKKVKTDESYDFYQVSTNFQKQHEYQVTLSMAQRLHYDNLDIYLDCASSVHKPTSKSTVSRKHFYKANQEIIDSVFRSKLFRFIFNIYWNGDNFSTTFFNLLPFLDLNKNWSDLEIYEYFGLTEEEIGYINSVID